MSTVLRFRRGDTTTANAFTGAEGELFVDTTKDTLVVHDGVTTGGKPLATESYVTTQINSLIDAAPTALNTLNELAAALGDDANYASTVTTALSDKVSLSGSYSNPIWIASLAYSKLTGAPSLADVATSGSYNDLTDKPTIQTFNQDLNTTNTVSFLQVTAGTLTSSAALSIQSGSNKAITLNPANGVVNIGINPVLHSGNVKTINGNSIYGSGDIVISGGGSESDPLYAASSWYTTTNNSSNWDTAYSWGNHTSQGYATESYVGTQLSSKQNTLVSGTSIKTINGQSLLGSGNITISGGSGGSSLTYGQFIDNEVDLTTTTADQVIDSFPAASYRTSKYIIQAVCSGVGLHSTEIVLIHDGSNVYITEYGTIFTDSSLFTVDANITAGDVNLTVTPVNANTSFDVVRTSLAARTYEAPSLQGDLMTLSGTEDLQTASGSVDLNV